MHDIVCRQEETKEESRKLGWRRIAEQLIRTAKSLPISRTRRPIRQPLHLGGAAA